MFGCWWWVRDYLKGRKGMSQKEIENKECTECESAFRLVYTLDDTSGYPKFCPFCSAEMYDDKDEELDEEDS